MINEYEERLALKQQYGGRIQAGRTLHLMAKIRLSTALKTDSKQHYDEALQYIREAADIFRETGRAATCRKRRRRWKNYRDSARIPVDMVWL